MTSCLTVWIFLWLRRGRVRDLITAWSSVALRIFHNSRCYQATATAWVSDLIRGSEINYYFMKMRHRYLCRDSGFTLMRSHEITWVKTQTIHGNYPGISAHCPHNYIICLLQSAQVFQSGPRCLTTLLIVHWLVWSGLVWSGVVCMVPRGFI